MATEMITVKMDNKFLEDIDSIVEKEGYQNIIKDFKKRIK